jgi:hypothetical protein
MSAPARPLRRGRSANRETRFALVPSVSAQADTEPRHSLPLGGTARSARVHR